MLTNNIPIEDAPRFTASQRFKLWLITWAGFVAIRLIGSTLRYSTTSETEEGLREPIHPGIYAFWHRCVIPACWRWRGLRVGILTSLSFDGEYIARIIQKFGYFAPRGSSSRGGARGLLEMQQLIQQGNSVAFTIDGPRGPIYVAKPGAIALGRLTGVRIVPFYVAVEDPWVLRSWDRMVVPKPFSRAHVRVGKAIHVPRDADDARIAQLQSELQSTLERVRDDAERLVHEDTKK